MRIPAYLGIGAILLTGSTASADPLDSGIKIADDKVRINELQFLGTHNSYKRFPQQNLYVCLLFQQSTLISSIFLLCTL
jgi:hypothetical protein